MSPTTDLTRSGRKCVCGAEFRWGSGLCDSCGALAADTTCDHCHSPLSAEEVGVVDVCATCCPHPRFTPEEWDDMRASGKADVVLALLRDIDAADHDWAL